MKKITVITPGKGREVNPYAPPYGEIAPERSKYWQWDKEHPELPAFYSDCKTELPVGTFEVDEAWQWDYKLPAMQYGWRDADFGSYKLYVTFAEFEKSNFGLQTRRVYIAPIPAPLTDAQPFKAVEEEKEITDLEIFIESWKPLGNQDYQQDKFMKDLNSLIQEVKNNCSKVKFTCSDCDLVEDKIKKINI